MEKDQRVRRRTTTHHGNYTRAGPHRHASVLSVVVLVVWKSWSQAPPRLQSPRAIAMMAASSLDRPIGNRNGRFGFCVEEG